MNSLKALLCLACITIIEAVALSPGGRNVCSRTERYVAYETRRYTRLVNQGYRTCCRRIFGACVDRCTRYRRVSQVYYNRISSFKYRTVYFCCSGWKQSGRECTEGICSPPCAHGRCTSPNVCTCFPGYQGPYCRQDINECSEMKLPDYTDVIKKKSSTVRISSGQSTTVKIVSSPAPSPIKSTLTQSLRVLSTPIPSSFVSEFSSAFPLLSSSSSKTVLPSSLTPVYQTIPVSIAASVAISKSQTKIVTASESVTGSGDGFVDGSEAELNSDGTDYFPSFLERQRINIPAINKQDVLPINVEDQTLGHNRHAMFFADSCSHICHNTYGSFLCACYKGFYLDKNKRTCRDVNECANNNGRCSHRCINTLGSYKCGCPSPLYLSSDGRNCKAHGMTVLCTKDYMQATFDRKLLKGLEVHHLRLLDASCKGYDNSTHIILRTALNKCGTTFQEKKHFEIYKNVIVNRDLTIGNLITRVRGIQIPFQCIYKRSATVTGVGFKPDRHRVTFSEDGFGNFTFTMLMFKGPRYKRVYSHAEFPVAVQLRDRLYFEVRVHSKDVDLMVFLDKCYATPQLQKETGPQYVFLKNGCSKDSTLQFSNNPTSYQRFNIEAFRFLEDRPNVFIHCEVIACHKSVTNSRCHQGCQPNSNRLRRDAEKKETNTYAIAEGPLSRSRRSAETVDVKEKLPGTLNLSKYMFFAGGIVCSALLLVSVYGIKRLRSQNQNHQYQKLSTHDRMD